MGNSAIRPRLSSQGRTDRDDGNSQDEQDIYENSFHSASATKIKAKDISTPVPLSENITIRSLLRTRNSKR